MTNEAAILFLLKKFGPMYGLEIVKKSNGALKRGSIYVSLDRAEDRGFVSSKIIRPRRNGERGPDRREYRITKAGMKEYQIQKRLAQDKYRDWEEILNLSWTVCTYCEGTNEVVSIDEFGMPGDCITCPRCGGTGFELRFVPLADVLEELKSET